MTRAFFMLRRILRGRMGRVRIAFDGAFRERDMESGG